jgi:hypothetical protein
MPNLSDRKDGNAIYSRVEYVYQEDADIESGKEKQVFEFGLLNDCAYYFVQLCASMWLLSVLVICVLSLAMCLSSLSHSELQEDLYSKIEIVIFGVDLSHFTLLIMFFMNRNKIDRCLSILVILCIVVFNGSLMYLFTHYDDDNDTFETNRAIIIVCILFNPFLILVCGLFLYLLSELTPLVCPISRKSRK